jgi:hypothetical protein
VIRIHTSRVLPVSPADAFAFLHEPQNHRRLTTQRIRLVELNVTDTGELSGALMVIHGPLGLRRLARTRLESTREPAHLLGTAWVGAGTEARVRWDLRPLNGDHTVVTLTATFISPAPLDRLLLLAGGRLWARRLFADTLERLAGQLTAPCAAAPARPSPVSAPAAPMPVADAGRAG